MLTAKPTNANRRNSKKRSGTNRSMSVTSKSNAAHSIPNSFMNAKRQYERYMVRARDAAASGDIIEAENLYQHAEHYLRQMQE